MSVSRSASSPWIYQLKIFLREISPMIWRRVLVGSGTTLLELHEVIQLAMGWEGYHLWTFSINGREYGHAYGVGPGKEDYETTLSVSDCACAKGSSTSMTSATSGNTRSDWRR